MPLTRSAALAAKSTLAPSGPVASAVLSVVVTSGAVVSTTEMVKLFLSKLLRLSRASQVTVVEPSLNRLPDAMSQATGTLPSTKSRALAV